MSICFITNRNRGGVILAKIYILNEYRRKKTGEDISARVSRTEQIIEQDSEEYLFYGEYPADNLIGLYPKEQEEM